MREFYAGFIGPGDLCFDVDGRRVTGRGVATDVVEASARAYLAAVNRAVHVTNVQRATNEETP